MARSRKLSPERKAFINSLIEHYHPEDAQDVQEMLKDLLGDTLQGMLEAEMDEKLGYSKYDYKNKETDDSRNGYSKKTVVSSLGEIDLDIPRDRKGEFEPQAVRKNQTDISNIEDQVLSMYAKGMTTRDISAHLRDVYGVVHQAHALIRRLMHKVVAVHTSIIHHKLDNIIVRVGDLNGVRLDVGNCVSAVLHFMLQIHHEERTPLRHNVVLVSRIPERIVKLGAG